MQDKRKNNPHRKAVGIVFYKKRNPFFEKKSIEQNVQNFFTINFAEPAKEVKSSDNVDCCLCYNYKIENNRLTTPNGFSLATFPISTTSTQTREVSLPNGEIKKIWFYPYYEFDAQRRVDKIVFYTADNKLYSFPLFSNLTSVVEFLEEEYNISLTSLPIGLHYRVENEDYMLFSSENGLVAVSSRLAPAVFESCPNVISMVKIYGYLWAIKEGDRNKIIFSKENDPTNWTNESGSLNEIDLSDCDKLMRLINFDDYLYVFREYGITKISQYGAGEEISVNHIIDSGSKIYPETICVCQNEILYFAEDGLYSFNGTTNKKLSIGFEAMLKNIKNSFSCACYKNGVYYLACKLDFDDDKKVGVEEGIYVNNALISIDPKNQGYTITRGIDICSLTSVQTENFNEILACFNSKHQTKIGILNCCGKDFDNDLVGYYKTKSTGVNHPLQDKILKEIQVLSQHDCKMKITSDRASKTVLIKGNKQHQRVKIDLSGKHFKFEISSVGQAEIAPIKIIYEKLKNTD